MRSILYELNLLDAIYTLIISNVLINRISNVTLLLSGLLLPQCFNLKQLLSILTQVSVVLGTFIIDRATIAMKDIFRI